MNKLLIISILLSSMAYADPPRLIDQKTGKYLGNLSSNQYDPNSTSNSYGQYGSKHSPDSINNEYGTYGSEYSDSSPNNPYATNIPILEGFSDY